ncbi:MAG: hypothetical protein Q7S06_01435 [Nanoarchaeota archaeon]|nr:hypothetical protein [Nanoarchaeota archaeon]
MADKIEFDKWYDKPLPHLYKKWPEDRGTSVKIRGTSRQLLRFIRFLHVEYDSNMLFPDAIVREGLEQVSSGKPRMEEFIGFGDDRIRRVTKVGSDCLEIAHKEQYGDAEGRKLMIDRVLKALGHMD